MECCLEMRRSRMTHPFFFKACFRCNGALCRRPLLFEQTASIQNLGRNRGGRFRQLRLLGSFFPYRAEVARGPVLINRLQVPPQENRRQWQPTQEFFKIHSQRVLALERPEPTKRGQELRVKLLEQLHLRRRQIALLRRAHDCNHTNESLVFPKKEADPVRAFLRRHITAIKGRFCQAASIWKQVANSHEPLALLRSDIILEGL